MSEHTSCVEVEVDVLGSPSLIVRTVSVDVNNTEEELPGQSSRAV